MTIIFESAAFWIETHIIDINALADATTFSENFNLDRSGALLNFSFGTSDNLIATAGGTAWGISLTDTANGRLVVGDYGNVFNALRLRIRNETGGVLTVEVWITVFLRKPTG